VEHSVVMNEVNVIPVLKWQAVRGTEIRVIGFRNQVADILHFHKINEPVLHIRAHQFRPQFVADV
jgi:hypothetical protein